MLVLLQKFPHSHPKKPLQYSFQICHQIHNHYSAVVYIKSTLLTLQRNSPDYQNQSGAVLPRITGDCQQFFSHFPLFSLFSFANSSIAKKLSYFLKAYPKEFKNCLSGGGVRCMETFKTTHNWRRLAFFTISTT